MPDGGGFFQRRGASLSLPGQRARRPVGQAPAVERHTADWLTLPRLPRATARAVKAAAHEQKVARMAQTLMRAGLLTGASDNLSLSEIVGDAIQTWLQSIWCADGKVDYLNINARLYPSIVSLDVHDELERTLAWRCDEGTRTAFRADFGIDPEQDHIAVVFEASERRHVNVERGVRHLEATCPGLGFEALNVVEDLGMSYGLLGGRWLKWCASYVYWGCGESEEEWADAYGESLDEYEGLTRAAFDRLVPSQWQEHTPLSMTTLNVVRANVSGALREAVDALISLRQSGARGFTWGDLASLMDWQEFVEPNVMLWWDGNTDLDRVADDYTRMAYEGEVQFYPGIGLTLIPTNDPAWFERMAAEWRPKAKTRAHLDTVLRFIARNAK